MVAEVTLQHVLDLAIGNPEVGAVNFNVLYSLMCLFIKRLETLQHLAPDQEAWTDFDAPMGPPGTSEATPTLSEYRASQEEDGKKSSLEKRSKEKTAKRVDEGSKTRTVRRSDLERSGSAEGVEEESEDSKRRAKKFDPFGKSKPPLDEHSPGNTVIMSKASWMAVQRKMRLLEEQMESMLRSGPSDLLEEIQRFSPDMPPTQMADLVQKLQVSHRLDTNEQLISRLSGMLEDNMTELQNIKTAITAVLGTTRAHALLDDLSLLKDEAQRQRTVSQESLIKMDAHQEELKAMKDKLKAIDAMLPGNKLTEAFVSLSDFEEHMREVRAVLGLGPAVGVLKFATVARMQEAEDEGEVVASNSTIELFMDGITKLSETVGEKMDKELFRELTSISTNLVNQVETVKNSANFIERYRLEHQYLEQAFVELLRKLSDTGIDVAAIREAMAEKMQAARARLVEKGIVTDMSIPSSGGKQTSAARSKSKPGRKSGSEDALSKSGEGSPAGSVSGSDSDESELEAKSSLAKKVDELEKELHELTRKMERLMVSQSHNVAGGAPGEDGGQIEDAKMKILELFESVEGLNEQINQLVDDGMDKQKQMQKLNETLFMLKETKAEQEEVVLLKEEKADKMMIEDKVDHALFESSLNEVNREIAALEDKINYIDECTQATVNNLNDAVGRKVERSEIIPLREYINSKVKMLLLKIRKLQSSSGPDDGAGTRRQLLRKFHCISCDKPVVAAGAPPWGTAHAISSPLASTPTAHPITTYEIELVRQSKRMSQGKKLLFHPSLSEAARSRRLELDAARSKLVGSLAPPVQEGTAQAVTNIADMDTRYCGGSHTLTFPFQRVGRQQQGHIFDNFPVIRQEVTLHGVDGLAVKGSSLPLETEVEKGKKTTTRAATVQAKSPEHFAEEPASPPPPSAGSRGGQVVTPGPPSESSEDAPSSSIPGPMSIPAPNMLGDSSPDGSTPPLEESGPKNLPLAVSAKKVPSGTKSGSPSAPGLVGSPRPSLSRTSSGMGAKFTTGSGSVGGGVASPKPTVSSLGRSGSVTSIRSPSATAIRSPSVVTARSASGTTVRSPQSGSGTHLPRTPPNGRRSQERRSSDAGDSGNT